jgi:amidase
MARYVRDLGPALAIIAGVDGHDSAVVPMPLGDPSGISVTGLRVASYTDDGVLTPTAETVTTVQAAAQALRELGSAVTKTRPDVIADSRKITERYWSSEDAGVSGYDVSRLMLDWNRFRSAMLTFMDAFDVLLCPASSGPAPLHGASDVLLSHYTLPFSLTGWPCVVVRAGTSNEGLPIAVQIVARPWREDVALAVAQQIETALGGWQPPTL